MSPVSEIVRFGCIGILATATHYGLLTLLVDAANLPPALSNGGAFCIALLVTYFGQSRWVFRHTPRSQAATAAKFGVSVLAGFAGNVAIMAVSTGPLGLDYRFGFVASVFLVPAASFVINKYWVFRKEERI